MTISIEILTSIISACGVGGILLFFVQRYFNRKDKEADARIQEQESLFQEVKVGLETLRLLAYARMSEETQRLLDKGFATVSERRILNEMYQNYKAHGWNGDMDARLKRVYSLPLGRDPYDEE